MLRKGALAEPTDALTPEEEIKEPYLLEFLDLKDEYSETEPEAALIAGNVGSALATSGTASISCSSTDDSAAS